LHGYVATKLKSSPAQEILQSELGEPILARWHVGLGWAMAWTSDVKNLWAVEWLRWPQWGQFWGQLVREHMRSKRRQVFDMRAEIDPATGHVRALLDAVSSDDRFENGLEAGLTIAGPLPGGPTRKMPMSQTAPGRYEADFALDRYGSFLLHASLTKAPDDGASQASTSFRPPSAQAGGVQSAGDDRSAPKSVVVAESFGHVTNPYPREYLALAPDAATLAQAAEITGGGVDPSVAALFDPGGESVRYHEDLWPRFVGAAIALFLLDLLLRRVRLFDRKRTTKPIVDPAGAPA
jgi:hypothetical protein